MVAELPDLLITDLKKPGLSGVELIKILRAHERTRSVPIWVISAGAEGYEAFLLEAGADMVMHKPFDLADLVRRVNQLFLKG